MWGKLRGRRNARWQSIIRRQIGGSGRFNGSAPAADRGGSIPVRRRAGELSPLAPRSRVPQLFLDVVFFTLVAMG
ncbi:hypothetical protein EC9_48100 [Rosistilla ulvae]|uniref:Uncharacterized protein n=1 Tax=Rosistilla ulvae TaxID=1930277 RepID=A0A517M6V8_9BACT|nr:hypothetical protein EC9_48100 [Rosistilla ulvae]